MAWIKDFKCYHCQSTMGVLDEDNHPQCFCCGANRHGTKLKQREMELLEEYLDVCDYETVCRIIGVEYGTNEEILPRINTPGNHWSQAQFTQEIKARYDLYFKTNKDD